MSHNERDVAARLSSRRHWNLFLQKLEFQEMVMFLQSLPTAHWRGSEVRARALIFNRKRGMAKRDPTVLAAEVLTDVFIVCGRCSARSWRWFWPRRISTGSPSSTRRAICNSEGEPALARMDRPSFLLRPGRAGGPRRNRCCRRKRDGGPAIRTRVTMMMMQQRRRSGAPPQRQRNQ